MARKFINEWTREDFEAHLQDITGHDKSVQKIMIAGDGNMNFTLRLIFDDQSSIIVKQSPPYCARIPEIPAPGNRIISEIKFYQLLEEDPLLARHSPKLLGLDKTNKIAYLSDLGMATDFEYLYNQTEKLNTETCEKLVRYLKKLHSLGISSDVTFENLDMRTLNHEYIFDLPFQDGERAIDLNQVTGGLAEEVDHILSETEIKIAAHELGKLYFENTRTLIHGDFYPMSWIETTKGMFIIDPEFGFLGLPEIDLGFFLAHMLLSNNFAVAYNVINKTYGPCDYSLMAKFCAVEVIRRISYVSQLPIINSLSFKKELLISSAEVLKTGNIKVYEILNHHDH